MKKAIGYMFPFIGRTRKSGLSSLTWSTSTIFRYANLRFSSADWRITKPQWIALWKAAGCRSDSRRNHQEFPDPSASSCGCRKLSKHSVNVEPAPDSCGSIPEEAANLPVGPDFSLACFIRAQRSALPKAECRRSRSDRIAVCCRGTNLVRLPACPDRRGPPHPAPSHHRDHA